VGYGRRPDSSARLADKPRDRLSTTSRAESTGLHPENERKRYAMPPGDFPGPGHGGHELIASSAASMGLIGWILLVILLAGAATTFLLWRTGRLPLRGVSSNRSPDVQAKQILAERFARGDISSEEFLDRCTTLNWTPGIDRVARGKRC
jgi:putative membrane protein